MIINKHDNFSSLFADVQGGSLENFTKIIMFPDNGGYDN